MSFLRHPNNPFPAFRRIGFSHLTWINFRGVGQYSLEAIEGSAFIFHVEKYGCSATVCVDAFGQVRQARGPCNESNRACKWATGILQRWGSAMPVQIVETGKEEVALTEYTEMDEAPF